MDDSTQLQDDEQAVESLEDSIGKILDEQIEPEVIDEVDEEVAEEVSEADTEESPPDAEESDESDEDEADDSEAEDSVEIAADSETGDIPDGGDDKLDPPEHWSPIQKERFNGLPKEGQEFLMETHKSIEGDYTRKMQEIAPIRKQYEQIQEILAPFEQEYTRAGLDTAGAVRQMSAIASGMRNDPQGTIQWLAQTYNVDLSADPHEGATDPALRSVLNEIGEIKSSLSRNEQQAKQVEHQKLLDQIQAFESETGEDGKLLHPHFRTVQDQITKLFQIGEAESLADGYTKAVRMMGLETQKPIPTPTTNANQAEKVKKAKRAAAGVKSSGTVGKKARPPAKTWEEEVASHLG